MEKIVKYQVVESQMTTRVAKLVNEAIEEDWQPYGNMLINPLGKYSQVMVQYKKPTVIDESKVIKLDPQMIKENEGSSTSSNIK